MIFARIQAWACESRLICRDLGVFVLQVDGTAANINNFTQFHREFPRDRLAWHFRAKEQPSSGFPRTPHQTHSLIRDQISDFR